MNREILRFVDTIHRDKRIEKEVIFTGIEMALVSAAQKKLGTTEGVEVSIDRETGAIEAVHEGELLSPEDLGRIAALSGKQVLLQKIREAEREVVYAEYKPRIGQLLTGTIQTKKPGGVLIISLGKAEGFLPRSEQSPAESFNEGDRIKVILTEVNMQPNRVQLVCSRASPDLVRRLFEIEIPEVADYVVEIKAIAREAGYRTKIAVTTYDSNVDCVGACVGVKGARIRNIVDELFGEKIDIVRWNDSIEILIVEALRPAEIASLDLEIDSRSATVYVKPDQQSLAIGRRGQNVRLASKLTGWDLKITPVSEEDLEEMRRESMEGLAQGLFSDRLSAIEAQEAMSDETRRVPSALDRLFTPSEGASESQESPAEGAPVGFASSSRGATVFESIFAPRTMETEGAEEVAIEGGEVEAAEASAEVPAARLEDLPGVGKVTAERMRAAGLATPALIMEAGEDALAQIEGIGKSKAKQIVEYLRSGS